MLMILVVSEILSTDKIMMFKALTCMVMHLINLVPNRLFFPVPIFFISVFLMWIADINLAELDECLLGFYSFSYCSHSKFSHCSMPVSCFSPPICKTSRVHIVFYTLNLSIVAVYIILISSILMKKTLTQLSKWLKKLFYE